MIDVGKPDSLDIVIAVTFEGLAVSTKSSLHKKGIASKLWNAGGVKMETNVKRVVKIQQSPSFDPGGRPASLIFDTIYESEEIEEGDDKLFPSLVAQLHTPHDKDCKIRINVYYTSNMSKEAIIMASTSFGFRDFLRSKKSTHKLVMGSEHCTAPVAYVRLLDNLPNVLNTLEISSRAENKHWNPLEKKYVFKGETDLQALHCHELTAEARLSFKLPLIFMKNFASILSETIIAWTKRAQLERLRRGNFFCREEAYENGWYEVTIVVGKCQLVADDTTDASPSTSDSEVLETLASSSSSSLEGVVTSEHFNRRTGSGQDDDFVRENSNSRESRRYSTSTPTRRRSVDDVIRPSTFVNVWVEDRHRDFLTPVGRTNTEYNTLEPVYGTNRRPSFGKAKFSSSEFKLDQDAVGNCVRLVSVAATALSDLDSAAEHEHASDIRSRRFSTTATYLPKNNAFQVYVPRVEDTIVKFQVAFEDVGSSRSTAVGEFSFSLQDAPVTQFREPDMSNLFNDQSNNQQRVVTLQIVNEDPSDRWHVHSGTMSVAVTVNRNSSQQNPGAPPLSPDIPFAKFPDFENNSLLSSTRVRQSDKNIAEKKSDTDSDRGSSSSDRQSNSIPADNSSPTMKRPPARRMTAVMLEKENQTYDSDDDSDDDNVNINDNLALRTSSPRISDSSPGKQRQDSTNSANSLERDERNSRPSNFTSSSNVVNLRHEDTSQLMTDCYEWLWHVGYRGRDPLVLDNEKRKLKSRSIDKTVEKMLDIGNISLSEKCTSANQNQEDDKENCDLEERMDIGYSEQFLWDYASNLEHIFSHVLMLISACEQEVSDSNTFRPSRLKKEIEFQPLPVNLHYQLLVVQQCSNSDRVKDQQHPASGFWVNAPNSNPAVVWDSVTCGAFSAHACGHKKGGLSRILSVLGDEKGSLTAPIRAYAEKMKTRRQFSSFLKNVQKNTKPSATSSSVSISNTEWVAPFAVNGPEAEMRSALVRKLEEFETNLLSTTMRRMYTMSQALSVAVNSFVMKLELVIENYIHSSFLERWMNHGFLIVHECLLSVSSKERAMIEDTWLAIETLQGYRIRLLPNPHEDKYRETNSWLMQNCNPNAARKIQSSTWWHKISNGEDGVDVHIVGREVQVFVSGSIVERLPEAVRIVVEREGAVFQIEPVMFSQGIDIMQTIATTMDSKEDIGDFQLHINQKALDRLNTYCEKVQPCGDRDSVAFSGGNSITSSHFEPHPLTAQLAEFIQTTAVSEKNVEMLIEVERICKMVGGCRVTFCKSGKDRTGMAITLEQSRLFGEIFATGVSDERILRDANIMRIYGTRLMVAEKNIGRPVYAINRLQVKFLPLFYRPPLSVTEKLIKSGDNS